MKTTWLRAGLLCLLFISGWLLLTCSKSKPLPTQSAGLPAPATLTVTPSHGAPGSLIEITGYTLGPADTAMMLFVGDQPTGFLADGSILKALVPLFVDSGGTWPTPPAGLQDVVLLRGNDTVGLADNAVAVDSLPHAGGTTEAIRQDLIVITNSLRTVWSALPQLPGGDERLQGFQSLLLGMLDSLVVGTDSSLEAILNGTSSWTDNELPDLALLDAILASSGTLAYFDDFAAAHQQFSGTLSAAAQSSIFCRGGGPDMDLACEMQIFVLLEDYKNYVVKPTTQKYTESVKIAADLIAISGLAKKPILIINALMQVYEFVYGTLAPSLFPAEVTAFTLTLDEDTIAVNHHTASAIAITAKNHPASIRATDVLDALIEALGLAKAPTGIATEFREIMKDAIEFALDLYRKCAVSYNTIHGGALFIDPEANLPELTWGPITVTHSDLVELYSTAPEILAEDSAAFEWKGMKKGEASIEGRPRGTGERSKVLIDNLLCLGCVYSGGAFGPTAPGTGLKTIVVGKPAKIDLRITGLPSGTDGSVMVDGLGGYSSGVIKASTLLTGLEPDDYHITAIEVIDGAGHEFVPDPVDLHVILDEGDSTVVEIEYSPKFGSVLVTVAGLPTGVEGDIDFSGLGKFVHITTDTLLDSLAPGVYTVNAHDVLDPVTSNPIAASPASQTVEVVGNATASCAVTYGKPLVVTLQVGNPYLAIKPSSKYPYTKWSEATFWPDCSAAPTEMDFDRYYDGQNGPGPGPAFGCSGNDLIGGTDSGYMSSAVMSSGSSAEGYVSFGQPDDVSAQVYFGGQSEATGGCSSVGSLQLHTWSWAILEIENKTSSDRGVWVKYISTGTSEGYDPTPYSGIVSQMVLNYNVVTDCSQLGVMSWYEVPSEVRLVVNRYNETTNLLGERFLTTVPPGKSYMQLVTTLVSTAGSSNTGGVYKWYRSQFQGTITIEIRP